MKELNEEYPCTTVGELKKLIQDMPDDWILVVPDMEADARSITHINSYWHGALTFEWDRD